MFPRSSAISICPAETSFIRRYSPGELFHLERSIQRAVISENWKYVRSHEIPVPDGTNAEGEEGPPSLELWGEILSEQLYRLESDPYERTNQIETAGDVVVDLRAILDRYAAYCSRNALTPFMSRRPAERADPKEIDRLEALGYL